MENGPIFEKTRELCQTILDQPEMTHLRKNVDTFLAHEDSISQYRSLVELSDTLNKRSAQGETLTQEELDDFDRRREELMDNPIARGFMDAQKSMQGVQEKVNRYLSKTFELGRIPEAEELECGSCDNHSCGCEH